MTTRELPPDAPAAELFPEYTTLYDLVAVEVEGLSEAQLDFSSREAEWMWWSIRRQVSHMATVFFRWLVERWGEQLWPQGRAERAELASLLDTPDERRLNPDRYWELGAILGQLRRGVELAQEVLARETVGSLQAQELVITVALDSAFPESGESRSQLWERFAQVHPRGLWRSPDNPEEWHLSLEATLRHIYFEITTHLRNVQRLKLAQGLPLRVQVPRVGYFTLPGWDAGDF